MLSIPLMWTADWIAPTAFDNQVHALIDRYQKTQLSVTGQRSRGAVLMPVYHTWVRIPFERGYSLV